MRKTTLIKTCKLIVCGGLLLSLSSQAGLINRGNGMIYDDVLDVTWLQDLNYAKTSGFDSDGLMNFDTASGWADGLDFGGFNDWRLPTIGPLNGIGFDIGFSFDGSTDRGFNQSSANNELKYMFSNNLNNTSYFDTAGNAMQPGSELMNWSFVDADTGELFSFINPLLSYWTGEKDNPIANAAWALNFTNGNVATGETQLVSSFSGMGAWALRDGDVAVIVDPVDPIDPIPQVSSPAVVGLFSISMLGILCGYRRLYYGARQLLRINKVY